MSFLTRLVCCLALFAISVPSADAAKPVFKSEIVSAKTPEHRVEIKAKLGDAKKLYLVVSDGGDSFGCDWAGWGDPKLIGKEGEKKLTDLKWKSASAGFGQVRVNANCRGATMRLSGRPVENGIGTHANSIIEYDLPAGFTSFEAFGFVDDGGTNQGCGSTVQFLVFTEKPHAQYLQTGAVATADRTPENALEGLETPDDLEAALFAAEPMLLSPSNIDVDHRGRVWVCEVVNYRHFRNKNNEEREAGDRILILEDTNGDGVADDQKVFYQGRDIDSAHGVCVLGNKAIVSAGDSVFVLTDTDGDDKADKKDVLFSGIAGTQHDHGIHSFLFGPDGKLYFNFGNAGKHLYDKDGNEIVDKAGNVVRDDRKPYQEGMVFRCNLDGSGVETLGWNFRNNWELAVDSFGNIWQSDNDDDGNKGVRINYVMEYGNYGYKDEKTGAGWRDPRTGMHEEIPKRHWHLNDPGVVPNLLQTGAGSPTGIILYEGDLLPERFQNNIIHCDAGPNIVRAYLLEQKGAGFTAEISNILDGANDKWFRPSDVCVAPDGSLIVADWYDPGVGGHAQGDIDRGRLFRVAPPGTKLTVPRFDFETVDGAIEALKSPNHEARYLAWTALANMPKQSETALRKVFESDPNPRFRARALWLLGRIDAPRYIDAAITDENDDIRITGLRLARSLNQETLPIVEKLLRDPSHKVQRELAVALRESQSDKVPALWAKLAMRLDPRDRWMLEALGMAADGRWDACLDAYLSQRQHDIHDMQAGAIVWRSRATQTPALLAELISMQGTPMEALPYLFRAFDFQDAPDTQQQLTNLAFKTTGRNEAEHAFIAAEALNRIDNIDFEKHPEYREKLENVIDSQRGTMQAIALINKFNLTERFPELLKLAQEKPFTQEGVAAMGLLLDKKQWDLINKALHGENDKTAQATFDVLGNTGKGSIMRLLMPLLTDEKLAPERLRQAVRALSRARNGAQKLVELARAEKLDATLLPAVAAALHTVEWQDIKDQAYQMFPPPPSKNNKPLAPLGELVKLRGNVERGKLIFNTTGTCAKCHRVNEIGKQVGPDLDEIGSKLSRLAMFESILFPSAGVSHNYENYLIVTDEGTTISGVMVSETPDAVTLKGADAIPKTVKTTNIEEMIKQKISLMPADLQKVMTQQDLIDVVDYMQTLKKK